MKINKIQVALFDLDGTLYNTTRANYLAYKEACKGFVEIEEDFFIKNCMSRNYKDFLSDLGISDTKTTEIIHERKKAAYKQFFGEITENQKLFLLADALRANGSKLALVTTASRKNTMELLEHFDRKDYFDLLVTQETVKHQKPFPDGFLYACAYFNAVTENCIIFEDSETGLQAALQTGAGVYKTNCF